MLFTILHRWTDAAIFTAEIEANEDTPLSIKLGLAVKAAVKAKANLRYSDLRGSDLSGTVQRDPATLDAMSRSHIEHLDSVLAPARAALKTVEA